MIHRLVLWSPLLVTRPKWMERKVSSLALYSSWKSSSWLLHSVDSQPFLTEDRHLNTFPSSSGSSLLQLPSPAEQASDVITSGPSFPDQDSVSIPEGKLTLNTSLCLKSHISIPPDFCFLFVHVSLLLFLFRHVWWTPTWLQWQSSKGKVHHENHPCQPVTRQQLQSHPFPIVRLL